MKEVKLSRHETKEATKTGRRSEFTAHTFALEKVDEPCKIKGINNSQNNVCCSPEDEDKRID